MGAVEKDFRLCYIAAGIAIITVVTAGCQTAGPNTMLRGTETGMHNTRGPQGQQPRLDKTTEQMMRTFTEVYQHIKTNYIRPVNDRLLFGHAVDSMAAAFGSEKTPVKPETLKQQARLSQDDRLSFGAEIVKAVAAFSASPAAPEKSQLLEAAIRGMVAALDPRSQYLSAPSMTSLRDNKTNAGVGLKLIKEEDRLLILTPLPKSPAERAGILPNDVLTMIDETPTASLSLEKAVELLRGEPDQPLKLTLERRGRQQPLTLTLRREAFKTPLPVVWSRVDKDGIALIRVFEFSSDADRRIQAEFRTVRETAPAGLRGLILDLRNNQGGVLDSAVQTADLFLAGGIITKIAGREGAAGPEFRAAASGDELESLPLVLLVNGRTASGAEIVAAALKENKRALIVGSGTYGYAAIQTLYPLMDNSALKLTTGYFQTPKGTSIEAAGVTPDVCTSAPAAPRKPAVCPKADTFFEEGEGDKDVQAVKELFDQGSRR